MVKRMSRFVCLLWVACLLPTGSFAATRWTLLPSLAVTSIHDDNVLLAAKAESDTVVRVSPSVALDARSERVSVTGRYLLDTENYRRHKELDSGRARYQGDIKATCDCTRDLQLGVEGLRALTSNAGDLNPGGSLQPGRFVARRSSVAPYAEYRINANWRTRITWNRVADRLAGSPDVTTTDAGLDAVRNLSGNDSVKLGYRHFDYRFEGAPDETADQLNLRWRHSLNDRTLLVLAVGPRRSSAGNTATDASASLRYSLARGLVKGGASREQSTLLGETGTASVETASLGFGYMLSRRLGVAFEGSHSNIDGASLAARSNQARVQAWFQLSRYLSLVAGFNYFGQHGDAGVPSVQRRTAMVTIVVGRAAPMDAPQLVPDARFLVSSMTAARQLRQQGEMSGQGEAFK